MIWPGQWVQRVNWRRRKNWNSRRCPCDRKNCCRRIYPIKWLYQLVLVGDRMRQRNDLQSADSILSAAYSVQRKVLGEGDPDLFYTLRSLGLTLESEGKLSASEQVHRQALDMYRKQGDLDNPQALSEAENLVHVLKAEKNLRRREQFLDEILTPAMSAKAASQRLLYMRADLRVIGNWPVKSR